MLPRWHYRFAHLLRALPILALLLTMILTPLAAPVFAAPLGVERVEFSVVAVKRDTSVTIRTNKFPRNTNFSATIGLAGKLARGGTVAGTFNSGAGGELEQTFAIPAEMQGKYIIGIRIDSTDGYAGYTWFFNRDQENLVRDPKAAKPELTFSGVKKNQSVTVEARGLPAGQSFRVRVGPHDTFYQKYVSAGTANSQADGTLKVNLNLPAAVKDVEFIGVRLDGGGTSAYAAFRNVDGGTVASQQELIKIVPCTIIDLKPIPALDPREDFDVTWTVQNTGVFDWEPGQVDLKFNGGEKMHKYEDLYDLNWPIPRGGLFQITLDMLAPDTAGYHKTSWAVVRAGQTLCTLNVTVFVNDK